MTGLEGMDEAHRQSGRKLRLAGLAVALLAALTLPLVAAPSAHAATDELLFEGFFATPKDLRAPTSAFLSAVPYLAPSGAEVSVSVPGVASFLSPIRIEIAPPAGQTLEIDAYRGVARIPFQGSGPGIDIQVGNTGCNTEVAQFEILDIAFGDNGAVSALALNFADNCDSHIYAGELRFNSSLPITQGLFGSAAHGFSLSRVASGATALILGAAGLCLLALCPILGLPGRRRVAIGVSVRAAEPSVWEASPRLRQLSLWGMGLIAGGLILLGSLLLALIDLRVRPALFIIALVLACGMLGMCFALQCATSVGQVRLLLVAILGLVALDLVAGLLSILTGAAMAGPGVAPLAILWLATRAIQELQRPLRAASWTPQPPWG